VLKAKGRGTIKSGTYPPNVLKAKKIYRAESGYEVHVSGPKVEAFFDNLTNPRESRAVTVDSHILRASQGNAALEVTGSISVSIREEITRVITGIAERESLLPSQVQAIIWSAWKRMTGSRNTEQFQKFFLF
jgi:hypothetical protein